MRTIMSLMPTFLHLQDQLAARLREANGLDLARVKAPAAGLGPVKLNVHITFAWIAAHQRRHLWQARRCAAYSCRNTALGSTREARRAGM